MVGSLFSMLVLWFAMMVSVLPSYENVSGFMLMVMVPAGCGRPRVGPVTLCSLAYFVSFGWDS